MQQFGGYYWALKAKESFLVNQFLMLFISAFISVYLLGEQSHYKDVSHVKLQCLNFLWG